tara:strand:- start:1205 stop:1420 length:216 start_codon:yes stop_codon:yes gene_type:complete
MKKIFLVTIVTQNKTIEWDYEPNTEIIIPVSAKSSSKAWEKVDDEYQGSEYPQYEIKSVVECDKFLFRPMI